MTKDRVRLALIGTGAWSNAIGDAMAKSEQVELVTCFDLISERKEAFSKKFGCDHDESFESLLKRYDLDGIHLTTPNAMHAEQTVLAAQYGKPVQVLYFGDHDDKGLEIPWNAYRDIDVWHNASQDVDMKWCGPPIVTIRREPGICRAPFIPAGRTVLFLYTWSEPVPSGRIVQRLWNRTSCRLM